MSNVLIGLLQAAGILALAFIAMILLVLIVGLVYAIFFDFLGERKDGDGDG